VKEVERITAANLMPSYLTREQFKADSIRAFEWFRMTKDSSYIDKYTYDKIDESLLPKKQNPSPLKQKTTHTSAIALIDDKNMRKKNYLINFS
jgi:penicillin-binding protein 2